LWIFPGDEPGDLEADQVAAGVEWGGTEPVIFRMSEVKPVHENSGGSLRIADSTNFPASKTVAAALVVVKPGSMRELHWHPSADEWQYYMAGSARMTVFNTGPHANTTDFRAGDVGLVRRNCGHYVENTGNDDLIFIETFRSDHYEEVSLANWLAHLGDAEQIRRNPRAQEPLPLWPLLFLHDAGCGHSPSRSGRVAGSLRRQA
jgi:oxalate decarboxylase